MNNSEPNSTCYMCDRIATSREHVPPLCLFPEKKDFPDGLDYRKNLITVPSCEEHNSKKSGDDEFLLSVFTTHIENNPIAIRLFNSKVVRALMRRPWMMNTFFTNPFRIQFGNQSDPGFIVNRERIDRGIDHISRGIFFYHFQKKALGTSLNFSYSIFDISSERADEINQGLLDWRSYSDPAWDYAEKYGENPEIFYYQVIRVKEDERTAIRLVFYEGVVFDILIEDNEKN